VVGRATEARPAANFHTRCFSSFFLRTSLPNPFLCSSEVGAEFDYKGAVQKCGAWEGVLKLDVASFPVLKGPWSCLFPGLDGLCFFLAFGWQSPSVHVR
jgi:hypothetical protein